MWRHKGAGANDVNGGCVERHKRPGLAARAIVQRSEEEQYEKSFNDNSPNCH